jgi:hypothetical protein
VVGDHQCKQFSFTSRQRGGICHVGAILLPTFIAGPIHNARTQHLFSLVSVLIIIGSIIIFIRERERLRPGLVIYSPDDYL